jgi:alpha-glucosidase
MLRPRIPPRAVLLLLSLAVGQAGAQQSRSYELLSPDAATRLTVEVGARITYAVTHRGRAVLDPSPISLTLANGRVL